MICSAGSPSSSASSPCGCLGCTSTRPARRGRDWLHQLYSAKRIARALLPVGMLRSLTSVVHQLETVNTLARSGVPAELRAQLMDRYYRSDIERLGRMTGLDVQPWLEHEAPEPAARPAVQRIRV